VRAAGSLTPEALRVIRQFFKVKNIYHSNAIEGNQLDLGETRMVIEQGLTITGKPLKDTAEAKNLSHALDYFEELASTTDAFTCNDIRQVHSLILKDIDDENAGRYRQVSVEVSGSAFTPPDPESVAPRMTDFCEWLSGISQGTGDNRTNVIGLAAAAHAWLVRVHPFTDGNGRTARIVMNLILMRYGYPIAVLTKDDRQRYYDALEASQSSDLTPFVALIAESVSESLDEYERAATEQMAQVEWAQSLVSKFTAPQRIRARNHYELWKSAMELFKNYVRQIAGLLDEQAERPSRIYFTDFGMIEYEKYLSLRNGYSAKRTWCFRTDFRPGVHAVRYLFSFGYASQQVRGHISPGDSVCLYVSAQVAPYQFERMDNLPQTNHPSLREIAYSAEKEQFVARFGDGTIAVSRVEPIVQRFFNEVVERNFTA
jgi:Fic family protein